MQFALSRQAKGTGAKPRDTSSAAASPSLSGQTQHEHTSMRGVPKTGNTSQGITQCTGSTRSQDPTLARDSVSHSDTRDDASQMTREIAAENQKLIASMQPEQASTVPTSCIKRTCLLCFWCRLQVWTLGWSATKALVNPFP